MTLHVNEVGPAVAIQDLGRPGYIAQGLTQGGAADRLAVHEGAALLMQSPWLAVLEMVGIGGRFEAKEKSTIALTGAIMRCHIDGAPVRWNASYRLEPGQVLHVGPVLEGTYGYLHIAGGFEAPKRLGGLGAHLSVGLGSLVQAGELLNSNSHALGEERILSVEPRLSGGRLRIMPSMQSHLFSDAMRKRLTGMEFTRDPRADRQGLKLNFEGDPFGAEDTLSIVSEIAIPGDVQIGGEGRPMILLSEGQTTGGYPRIGTILPSDLPRAVQCPSGGALRFEWVTHEEARAFEAKARAEEVKLPGRVNPRVRSPMDIANLRDYNLISGAITGD